MIVGLCIMYGITLPFAWRALAGHHAYRIARQYPKQNGKPDRYDWLIAVVEGFLLMPVWPLLWLLRPVSLLRKLICRIAARVGGVLVTGAELFMIGAEAEFKQKRGIKTGLRGRIGTR